MAKKKWVAGHWEQKEMTFTERRVEIEKQKEGIKKKCSMFKDCKNDNGHVVGLTDAYGDGSCVFCGMQISV